LSRAAFGLAPTICFTGLPSLKVAVEDGALERGVGDLDGVGHVYSDP
jgi:hypothetical protein